MQKNNKLHAIWCELKSHMPFSIFGVSASLVIMGFLTFIAILLGAEESLPKASHELFHVFHPLHILFSAMVTTAMFWKHEKSLVKALLVGIVGSLGVCGISDIAFPFIGGTLIGAEMQTHICLLENPQMILTFLAVGVMAGLVIPTAIERSTQISHSAHVCISSLASLLYLLSYGVTEWTDMIGQVFLITIFAIVIPCCLSDIVFPLVCLHKGCGCENETC